MTITPNTPPPSAPESGGLPAQWPYRADPPNRYWDALHIYRARGGQINLENDIKGFTAGGDNPGDISRFYFFCMAFDQLMKEGVVGDIAELGTYKGHTASLLAIFARRMLTTAWILDTFEGFNAADFTGPDAGQPMQFQDTSLEAVRALVGEDSVRYVKGYFPGSASQMPDDLRFALVHIDCDLYAPILHALQYFYPRLLPGGYLIVHDYASLAWEGAEKAVDDFFAGLPEAVIPLTDGGGSVVIRKARSGHPGGNWQVQRRRALLTETWTDAGNGGLVPLLAAGWSGAEPWGVWGTGASHTLRLSVETIPPEGLAIHVRASAALTGPRPDQVIDVLVQNRMLASWEFSTAANGGERHVVVPPDLAAAGPEGSEIFLEFRPRSVIPTNVLVPGSTDERALGLGLTAIRRDRA